MKFLSSPFLPVAAILGSITSLCIGASFAKNLFPVVGAQGTTVMRLTVAALILTVAWRPWRWKLTPQDAKAIGVYGVVLGIMNLLFYLAIARIPLGVAIAIEFTGPLVLAISASRRVLDFVWIAFAILGLGLLLPLHQYAAHLDPLGVMFALGAAVCWALYIITGQRASHAHGGQATSLGMLVAAMVVFPFGAQEARVALFDPALLLAGLGVGILSSAVPYSLEMVALKRIPKHTFGILLSLEPAVGALVAWIILHEMLTPLQWVAIACIIVASVGSTLGLKTGKAPVKDQVYSERIAS